MTATVDRAMIVDVGVTIVAAITRAAVEWVSGSSPSTAQSIRKAAGEPGGFFSSCPMPLAHCSSGLRVPKLNQQKQA